MPYLITLEIEEDDTKNPDAVYAYLRDYMRDYYGSEGWRTRLETWDGPDILRGIDY